jgi:hypothetical protein
MIRNNYEATVKVFVSSFIITMQDMERFYSPLITIMDANSTKNNHGCNEKDQCGVFLEELQWHTPIIHDITALNKNINQVQTEINRYRKQQQKEWSYLL